jgi:ubiquinone/menaquinone biosynthesis C-methylase UbiE
MSIPGKSLLLDCTATARAWNEERLFRLVVRGECLDNYFAVAGVGRRYAQGRPYIHSVVADEIVKYVGRVGLALDIGAGTGLSTRALLRCANHAIGVDPSMEMLRAVSPSRATAYVAGRGELLPFQAAKFELATIGSAYHWCDCHRLLREVDRVLSRGGWFAIYDSEFLGLARSSEVIDWLRAEYWAYLPRCPHNPAFDANSHIRGSFGLAAEVSLEAEVAMTLEEAVRLITTQASTIHAVRSGAASLSELEARIREGFRRYFPPDDAAAVRFVIPLSLLHKS